jgi:tellurite resistance protein TehA-like permease
MLIYLEMGDLFEPTLVITYLAWAAGAWWIPILLLMDVWAFYRLDVEEPRPLWITVVPWARLGFGRGGNHVYEPTDWGRVFPVGMFTAATIALTEASGFDVLSQIPSSWGWFALGVWAVTMLGTLRAVRRGLRHRGSPHREVHDGR